LGPPLLYSDVPEIPAYDALSSMYSKPVLLGKVREELSEASLMKMALIEKASASLPLHLSTRYIGVRAPP
jgi:hypothetical protein